mgnify:CR=1 FL=1
MKYFAMMSAVFISLTFWSQEAAEKKVQAGIAFGTGFNFNESGTRNMEVAGLGNSLMIGVDFNYELSKTIAFSSGLMVDFETNKIRPAAELGNVYYHFDDKAILRMQDANANSDIFQLVERSQKPVYVTIPTMLMFRTKFFGYNRFFSKIGLRNSFLVSNKVNDSGFTFENNDIDDSPITSSNENMSISRNMNIFRSSFAFSLGYEWNFSGTTSLVGEVGYRLGFVPIYFSASEKNQSNFYFDSDNNNAQTYYNDAMNQNQLHLRISVLF